MAQDKATGGLAEGIELPAGLKTDAAGSTCGQNKYLLIQEKGVAKS